MASSISRVQHNIAAMNALRNYKYNNSALSKNLEKLSSGFKINRAGDDAAGLAISEKMRAQITGISVAQKNANDGISLVQTAEGALTEVHDMLNRMTELATQSANGTYESSVDRAQLQKEVSQLRTEINRIADSVNFNGINLLDGSLSSENLTAAGIETTSIDMAKGVEVTEGTVGGGTKGEYTLNLTNAFGDGDTIALTFGGNAGNGATNVAGSSGVLTLTYGTHFSGATIEEQAQSLAKAISGGTNVNKSFNVTVDGTTIKLTALEEGNKQDEVGTVTQVTVTNKDASQHASDWKRTAGTGTATNELTAQFATLFDNNDGSATNIPKDSTISFEVTYDSTNSKTMTVSLTEGVDFSVGNTASDTIDNIVTALNRATFEDNDDTKAIDESLIKVSDMFEVTANSTGTGIEFKSKSSTVAATGIKFTGPGNIETTSAQKTAAAGDAATKDKYELVLASGGTSDATDLALGDTLTFKGELADGRKFEFDLTAGEDFDIGANFAGTMANLETKLETKGIDIEILDKNGKSTGETISSTEIFGSAKEIDFTASTAKFESTRAGTVFTSKITEVTLTNGDAAEVSETLNNGQQKSSAESKITFGEGLSYGATITIGDNSYEIVRSTSDISSGKNVAVVVSDLTDTDSAAKALASAVKDKLNDSVYKVTASGSTVTVGTVEIGSSATAINASASGDKLKVLEFTLDPGKMQAGSTVSINGQTYEFVEKASDAADGNTAIVTDFETATAKTLGSALASVADGVQNAKVNVDSDGVISVRGIADSDGNITDPTVTFGSGKAGLKLQIGDTSDDFNQLKVSVRDMHTDSLGLYVSGSDGSMSVTTGKTIADIDISTQEGAAEAVDIIKSAINMVSDVRGTLGATQNRLDHTISNLGTMQENLQAAESAIRDTDVAEEMMIYTKNSILNQAAQAMLAQANQLPQGVLQLLQ